MDMRDLMPWAGPRSLTRREGADPFVAFQRELNRLFDDLLRGGPALSPAPEGRTTTWPTMSISETPQAYVIKAEVPGLDAKDVELSVIDDTLVLRGEKKQSTEDAETHVSEHFYGRFERRLPLGNDVDRDKISASFDKGVLTITLPKRPETTSGARRIQIAGGQ